ncbi:MULTISPECIES: hypothetical protein [Rheinheimera]|uniref:Transmembrane cytochrome oxidase associated protein n=1 Tax=Rheinheimera marina TaxID=1774958 RepID=A0ABV9JGR8_9GAMM
MKKSRFLLFFVVCLVLPLAAAQAVLSFGWFSDKTNNKGQWLTEELLLLPAVAEKQHWRLAYLTADTSCDMRCEEAAYLQQQVYQALGRKQDYLALWQLGAATAPAVAQQALPAGAEAYSGQLVLVDRHGLGLLSYPVALERELNVQTGKAILADLNKLLKYERGL